MWPFGKNKSLDLGDAYQTAMRRIDTETTHRRPSWLGKASKEREFFDGVMTLARRGSAPIDYAARGFMSPQSSEVMFSFVASMESQGASFDEQQAATAKFIEQMWKEMLPDDKEYYLKATKL